MNGLRSWINYDFLEATSTRKEKNQAFLTLDCKTYKVFMEEIILTILPLGVLNGQADEYSKPVFGSITGCSPMTPIPLQKGKRTRS